MSLAVRLRVTFSFFMSGLMSGLMSAWITWLNFGLGAQALARLGHTFVAAWPAAFATVLLLAPLVQRLSQRLVHGRVAVLEERAPRTESRGANSVIAGAA